MHIFPSLSRLGILLISALISLSAISMEPAKKRPVHSRAADQRRKNLSFQVNQKNAEEGSVEHMWDLSVNYIKGEGTPKNNEMSLRWLFKAAKKGHIDAQTDIAIYYRDGIIVEKNLALGELWFSNDPDRGRKLFELGNCYLTLRKNAWNYEFGEELLQEAAVLGNLEAMLLLARHYREAVKIEKNLKKSLQYLLDAAQFGNLDAQNDLVVYYREGIRSR